MSSSNTLSIQATLKRASDWESWSHQFEAKAVAYRLWDHIDPDKLLPLLKMPQLPKLEKYDRRTPPADPPISTQSQTQADAPAAEPADAPAAEPAVEEASAADLTEAGRAALQIDMQFYAHREKQFQKQDAAIQKLKTWVADTIAPHYFDLACDADETLATWFKNLKKELGIDEHRSKEKARDQYERALKPLTQIKGWESWLENWEKAISLAKRKKVATACSKSEWVNDFLNAVNHVTGEWSLNYNMMMNEQIRTGQLTFRDLANNFRDAMERRYPGDKGKAPKVAPGSFGPTYAGHDTPDQGAAGDAQCHSAEEENKSQHKRRPSKRKHFEDIEPSCAACGLKHRLSVCFYIFPQKAPHWFRPDSQLRDEVKNKLATNESLQEQVEELKNKRAKR